YRRRRHMLNKLKNLWHQEEGMEKLNAPKEVKFIFILTYKGLEIGYLTVNEGIWHFKYSDQFKQQHSLPPLIDFPSIDKVYKAKSLWPFFASRIPGLNQPIVQEAIVKDKIDSSNEAELLKRFGKHTISNPFILEPEMA